MHYGLKIDFANDCENIEILFDEYSFTNSVSQLINNAIKFSNKGEIKVSLFIENNQLKINVKDEGIGISKEFENEVFEPYTQEDIGYNRSYEGIGLGLSLSQKLMALSGSNISFVSQKGKGSVFTININQNVEIRKIENNKDIEMNDADINQKQKQLNILVVEDDFSSQELIKMILQKLDHKVLFAYNAQDAEELLKKNKFDVIFMDISLRGSINGLQFTKQIKKDPKFADIPVIAVTAHAFEADKIASLEAGCSDVIIKPLRKIEIENVLKKYT
jgi:CheY-like chemotaxis protein